MTELDRKVLDQIERRKLAPRPAIYFLAKRSVLWALAALSIVLGAVSVAIIIYRVGDHFATGGRGFDEMPFDDIAEFLPGVWVASLLLFIASAVLAISQTRRGYRFRRGSVIGVVAAVSIVLGLVLYALDAGPIAHRYIAERSEAYREFTYIPYDEWMRPDEGFLGGEVLSEDPGRSLRIRDFDGMEWDIDTSSAGIEIEGSLVEEGDIAIQGERTGPSSFRAESIDEFD